jgi:hypothetical protein
VQDQSVDDQRLWVRPTVIVAVAVALRLVWALIVPIVPISDSVLYDAFARSIATGKGFAYPEGALTAYWPVGASAVYGTLYRLFGLGYWSIVAFQIALGGAIVALTMRAARRCVGPTIAPLAGWFTALWPILIQFTTVMASELIFMALLLLAINAWLSDRLPVVVRALLWGSCIAAATYVRPTAWPLLVLFPIAGWLVTRNLRAMLTTFLVSGVCAVTLFAPWTYRNFALFDRFVLIAANGGVNLWMGNNPQSNGGYMPLPPGDYGNEAERDRHFGREAAGFIKASPGSYLGLSARRLVTTYDRESIGVVWNEGGLSRHLGAAGLKGLKLVSAAYWWCMLLSGVAGIVLIARDRGRLRVAWPVALPLAFLAIVPVLTVGGDRYHLPLDPVLAIFAAVAASHLTSAWRRRATSHRS